MDYPPIHGGEEILCYFGLLKAQNSAVLMDSFGSRAD